MNHSDQDRKKKAPSISMRAILANETKQKKEYEKIKPNLKKGKKHHGKLWKKESQRIFC